MPREIQFGSLTSRQFSEKADFSEALVASDVYTDRDGLQGRNGYRAATASAIGSTSAQLLGRQRVSPTSVKNIAVCGGAVYTVTDPSSETASDGTISASLGSAFASSAKVSGAQLYKNYYLGTDEASVAMRRVNSGFTLDTLQDIQQGAKPTLGSFSALAWTLFNSLAAPAVSGCVTQNSGNTGMSGLGTNWVGFTATNNGNDDPAAGSTAQYIFAGNFDASAYDWLAVAVTPHDEGGSAGTRRITVQVAEQSAGNPDTWIDVGTIFDVPPVADSPNLIFCDLRGIGGSARDALRYLRFYVAGASGGKFAVYGYVFLPGKPLANPQTYYVTCQDATTLQESKPTEPLLVTIKDSDKLNQGSPTPDLPYVNCVIGSDSPKNNGGVDSLLGTQNRRNFNREAGKTFPSLADIGAVVSITVTLNASWIAGQVLRLWKDTSEGRRLVTTYTLLAGDIVTGTKVLSDPGGLAVLSNVKYKPGGTGPRTNLLLAFAGRLVAGYENRFYVSSFTAPDVTSSIFPQWPDVALESADGWSADIDGAYTREQFQTGAVGDAVYLSTNERTIFLPSLEPRFDGGRVYYDILDEGCVSRRGAIWANGMYIWASPNGVYAARDRMLQAELTEGIRDYYWRTFAPDSTTLIEYQARKLYVTCGTRQIRYDFVTQRWTTHTLTHARAHGSSWFDVGSSTQTGEQMWALSTNRHIYRWQPDYTVGTTNAATSDAGTAIPDWQYSTGFEVYGGNAIPKFLYMDATNSLDVFVDKTATDDQNSRKIHFTQGEQELAFPPDLKAHKFRLRAKAANTTIVRRMIFDREPISNKGG